MILWNNVYTCSKFSIYCINIDYALRLWHKFRAVVICIKIKTYKDLDLHLHKYLYKKIWKTSVLKYLIEKYLKNAKIYFLHKIYVPIVELINNVLKFSELCSRADNFYTYVFYDFPLKYFNVLCKFSELNIFWKDWASDWNNLLLGLFKKTALWDVNFRWILFIKWMI